MPRVATKIGSALLALATLVPTQVAHSPSAAAAESTATTVTVSYWNDVLLELYRRADGVAGAPGPLSRSGAIMHGGIYDALNNGEYARRRGQGTSLYDRYTTLVVTPATVDDNLTAGLVARDLLLWLYPSNSTFINQKYAQRHGAASQPEATELAATIVADARVDRGGDGSGAAGSYTPDNVPGAWRPTGNGCTTAVTPQYGAVDLFGVRALPQPALPGGFTSYAQLLASDLYARNVNEVKSLGSATSTTRTARQRETAFFWANDVAGTYRPPGQLMDATQRYLDARITDPLLYAQKFTTVALALADAGIAAWNAKYRTSIDLWRPESAVRLAQNDGNPATAPDSTWTPLSRDRNGASFSPCFPAWISGHATFAGAWAAIMDQLFPTAGSFSVGTEDPNAPGVVRTYTSFSTAAAENARSRVFLGVHYQFDADDGLATGRAVTAGTRQLLPNKCDDPCRPY